MFGDNSTHSVFGSDTWWDDWAPRSEVVLPSPSSGERTYREGGGGWRATGSLTARFKREFLTILCSGTTVAARCLGRGRRTGSSSSCASLEGDSPNLVWVLPVADCGLVRDSITAMPSICWMEGGPLLLWGSERSSERGALHSGSWTTDRSLSEWERHSLLCLCLLKTLASKRERKRHKSVRWTSFIDVMKILKVGWITEGGDWTFKHTK